MVLIFNKLLQFVVNEPSYYYQKTDNKKIRQQTLSRFLSTIFSAIIQLFKFGVRNMIKPVIIAIIAAIKFDGINYRVLQFPYFYHSDFTPKNILIFSHKMRHAYAL